MNTLKDSNQTLSQLDQYLNETSEGVGSRKSMNPKLRAFFMFTMTLALAFGYLHLFVPGDFERLHIFLYNLVSGGTILLYFTENKGRMTIKTISYFILSLVYTVTAFYNLYFVSMILGIILAFIVESIRIAEFQFFPWEFFSKDTSIGRMFLHAAVLCLSIGLFIASFAIWNEQYGHVLSFEKLTLNTFFLGFSFPLSLVTLALVFDTMKKSTPFIETLKTSVFWTITVGVIIFFLFILFNSAILELIISLILFTAVSIALHLYIKLGIRRQQKAFLTSGVSFLLLTSTLGVIYISYYFIPGNYSAVQDVLLHYHKLIALYGWNMSGFAIILRYNDFPIRLEEKKTVLLHWFIVAGVAPLGYYFKGFAIISLIVYAIFLYLLFFSKPYFPAQHSTTLLPSKSTT